MAFHSINFSSGPTGRHDVFAVAVAQSISFTATILNHNIDGTNELLDVLLRLVRVLVHRMDLVFVPLRRIRVQNCRFMQHFAILLDGRMYRMPGRLRVVTNVARFLHEVRVEVRTLISSRRRAQIGRAHV